MSIPPHRTQHELIAFCEDTERRIKPGVLVKDVLTNDIGIVVKVEWEYCPRFSLDHKWKATIKWNSKMKFVPSFMNEFEAGWVEIISEKS